MSSDNDTKRRLEELFIICGELQELKAIISQRSKLELEVEYLRRELDRCQREKYALEQLHTSYVKTRQFEREIAGHGHMYNLNPLTPQPIGTPSMIGLEVRRHSNPTQPVTPRHARVVAADEVLQAVLTSEGSPLMWSGNPAMSPMSSSPPSELVEPIIHPETERTYGDLILYDHPRVHWHPGTASPPL
jgi:hypothetical protein